MNKLKLSQISDLAQVVSAVAVVLSLIYVGQQIRVNTEATRAATRQSVTETDFEYISSVLDPILNILDTLVFSRISASS